MSIYTKEQTLEQIKNLYNSIDEAITILVNGRLRHDTNMILKAQNIMESLMVSTMQDLSVIKDYIKEKD